MSSSVKKLVKAQTEIRKGITKLITNFKKTSSSRYTVVYLETRCSHLEEYWLEFKTNHKSILELVTEDEKLEYLETEQFDEVEEFYLDYKTIFKEWLAKIETKITPECKPTVEANGDQNSRTKLPPIQLPRFSGDYKDWMHYKDMFLSLIHKNTQLSDVEKHHYLRTSLFGEAEQLLRHFEVTAANYTKAWSTLETRFSNKRVIVNNLFNRFFNQRKLTTECSRGLKELINTTRDCLNGLQNLRIDTETWDPIIIHIMVSKLDSDTHKSWEQSMGASTDLPTLNSLIEFLEGRFRAIEMTQIITQKREIAGTQAKPRIKTFTTELDIKCTYCQQSHYICHCAEFASQDVEKRIEFVKSNGLCFNCLVKGHAIKFCKQHTACKICGRKHHTLLHRKVVSNVVTKEIENDNVEAEQVTSMSVSMTKPQVVLATATILVKDKQGEFHKLRGLVDQGSQATFITEEMVQVLGLPKNAIEATVTGISNKSVLSRHSVTFDIYSTIDKQHILPVQAHILKKLTHVLPTREFNTKEWEQLQHLELSDNSLHKPGKIDLILGAEVYSVILLEGLYRHKSLIAQNTRLGWLVSGVTANTRDGLNTNKIEVATTLVDLDQTLRKFWETEEYLPHEKPLTLLEQKCEEHFVKTHSRDEEGRFVVRLPFRDNFTERLGDSKQIAMTRLSHMERRFARNPKFEQEYTKFIDEYQTLDHLEDVSPEELIADKVYYLPHHAVIRECSITTKLRVVFDGSAKPTNGTSLNDELLIGPSLHQDLRDLIVRWRVHKIGLVSDVKQMYRQLRVAKEDCDYQRILWRNSVNGQLVEKRLLTVTYGTSCAPYIAIRALRQLADDEQSDFPELVNVIKSDFFMDDFISGASDESDAIKLQQQITKVMARGKFELHKWASNSPVVLQQIDNKDKCTDKLVNIQMDSIKTLGIKWNPKLDVFELKIDISQENRPYTKTTVLSDIARSFDPLGYLGPVIIKAKIFLQKLWLCPGLGWNDELSIDLAQEWHLFRDELSQMNVIYLNRWFNTYPNNNDKLEIHGFSDASTVAYSAVVYLRVIRLDKVTVSLVIAKTKVAPVKQVSLPRLELCGAVLLSKLLNDVKTSLNIDNNSVFAWTDFMIVLSWLRKSPNTWKTYVANRTTEILNVLSNDRWHHINSANNPADCASRGLNPSELQHFDLWWHGPFFLHEPKPISSSSITIPDTDLEFKPNQLKVNFTTTSDDTVSYLSRFSKLSKLVRVTAYILRFVNNCKLKVRNGNILTVDELKVSLNVCIRMSQQYWFSHELDIITSKKQLTKSSKLCNLCPFIDKKNIMRVSGRLHSAPISDNAKHPIILSAKCNLTKLIIAESHIRTLHGGPQLVLNVVRRLYWIIGGKTIVKKVCRNCVKCFRQSPKPLEQLMGQLPPSRVTPAKVFLSTGIDMAGPVTLKLYPGRCQRTTKAYICIFVCMVTKAIHLELLSNLSSAAFIACFRRFTARRGHCKDLWSDCGTNFVGASKELDVMFKNSKSEVVREISELLANDNTTWHFIAPGSPHMGGIWESGIKSVKGHIKRVINQTLLTFEEYSTLLTQIETCVNSRPLTQISDSIDDFLPLTPGHFLIGDCPLLVPDENLESVKLLPNERWRLIQRMMQCFWKRWSQDYLTTLQNRYKWHSTNSELKLNDLVLVKDERLPPGKWLLARITEKHPGRDNLSRVYTLKTKNGYLKRSITKLCPLPVDESL